MPAKLLKIDKKVGDLMLKKDQLKYVNELKSSDRPNLSKATATLLALEKISSKDFKEPPTVKSRKIHVPRAGSRTHVVPKNCQLNVTNAKIAGIYEELRKLLLSSHVHAIGVLLRVFLEMSVDDYLENKAKVKLTFVEPKSGRTIDKKLKEKVKETIAYMVSNGAAEKDFKGVVTGLNDNLHPFSIDTLHAYIHNRFFTPTDIHLVTGWDNSQRFFEAMWP